MMNDIFLQHALDLYDIGLNVVPAANKHPVDDWKDYQSVRYPREKLIEQLSSGYYDQLFLVCGNVSGGIVCLDFDKHEHDLYKVFMLAIPKDIRGKLTLVERTQHGGYHIIYRSSQNPRSKRLAQFYNGELTSDNQLKLQPLIETRGEGGGFICAPSAGSEPNTGYYVEAGSYAEIPMLTAEEEDKLYDIAQKLDKRQEQELIALKKESDGTLEDTEYTRILLAKAHKKWDKPQVQQLVSATTNTVQTPTKLADLTNLLTNEEKQEYYTSSAEERKALLKTLLPDYLQAKGIDPNAGIRCPHPNHNDDHASAFLHTDGEVVLCSNKKPGVHPDKCAFDIFDIVGYDYNLSFAQAYKKIEELFGLNNNGGTTINTQPTTTVDKRQETQSKIELWHSTVNQTDMWVKRGISPETVEKYNLGYDVENNRLVIPTAHGCYNARNLNLDAEYKYVKSSGEFTMFHQDLLFNHEKPLYVVESEICAMSIEQAGGTAMALGGTSNAGRLVKILSSKPKAELEKLQPLILALDNDDVGQSEQTDLAKKLSAIGCPYIIYKDIFGEYKDANERWLTDPDGLKQAVTLGNNTEALKQHLAVEHSKHNSLLSFAEALNLSLTDPSVHATLSTGIRAVDEALGGGLRNELYVIGACSSLGKTTLVHQVADHLARGGKHVLFYSLEMSKEALVYKSLTRLSALSGTPVLADSTLSMGDLYAWSITPHTQEEHYRLSTLISQYMTHTAPNLYIQEASGTLTVADIRAQIEQHVEVTGVVPILFVDYLQILGSPDDRWDTKKTIDFNISELKRISRDLHTPVILISSLNRANYTERISMQAFKESGSIEYGCDVLIGLQLSGVAEVNGSTAGGKRILKALDEAVLSNKKSGMPLLIDFRLLKNRSGANACTHLTFHSRAGYFCSDSDIKSWVKSVWAQTTTGCSCKMGGGARDWLELMLGAEFTRNFQDELGSIRRRKESSEDEYDDDTGSGLNLGLSYEPNIDYQQDFASFG